MHSWTFTWKDGSRVMMIEATTPETNNLEAVIGRFEEKMGFYPSDDLVTITQTT